MKTNNTTIISANYLDRTSPYKWLVRNEQDPVEKAVACKEVKATNVSFRASSTFEEGFGCRTVAVTNDEVEIISPEPKPVELRFVGDAFYDPDYVEVREVSTLHLTSEGKMIALVK